MRYVVLGLDGTDSEALARRLAVRPAHLEAAKPLIDAGVLRYGGPLLDKDGNMNGSIMILDYPSEEALRAEFLSKEPYFTEGVWKTVEVYPHQPGAFCE